MTWASADFPFVGGSGTTPGPTFQYGSKTNVPADASSTVTVSVPVPYTTSLASVIVTIGGGLSWNGYQLSSEVTNLTTSSFQVTVSGGAPGSTVTIYWMSQGT
jgi:hypothetical protein